MAKPWSQTKAIARNRAGSPLDQRWAEDVRAKVLASCHSHQRAFVEDPGRRVSGLVGRGGGKTTSARARATIKMASISRAKLVYLATTREHARELMWDPLKDLTERLGIETTFHEERLVCTFRRNGSRIRLFGADDMREIDKLRGQSFHEVQIDEAASHPDKVLKALIERIVGPRLGDFGGCIVMFGTPGHVLSGMFYDATRPSSPLHRPFSARDDEQYAGWTSWSSHGWTLLDAAREVPAISRLWDEALVEKAANGWSDDHPVWQREYLARWAADDTETIFKYRALQDGQPWNQWDPERVGPMRVAALPGDRTDWVFAYGMDMGHSDAFALNVFAASPSDPSRRIYQVFGFERVKMYARSIAQLLLGTDDTQPNGCCPHERPQGVIGATGWPAGIVADLSGLGGAVIDELSNVYGIAVARAEQKDKFGAIELFNGDLVDGRIQVLKDSALEKQLLELQWVANEFGQLKENKAQANHSTDAAVYSRRLLANIFETEMPPPPASSEPADRAPARPQIERDDGADAHGEFDALLFTGTYDEWGNT